MINKRTAKAFSPPKYRFLTPTAPQLHTSTPPHLHTSTPVFSIHTFSPKARASVF
jgi:hypothetical protein